MLSSTTKSQPEPSNNNRNNRAVFIGDLPQVESIADLLDHIRCESVALESVKYLQDRKCLFLHFANHEQASRFIQHWSSQPLQSGTSGETSSLRIRGTNVRIGWARPVNPIPTSLRIAIQQGATRCIYIGNIDCDEEQELLDLISGALHSSSHAIRDFQDSVENIRIVSEKHCAFIHMLNIQLAVQIVDILRHCRDFKQQRIGFGKDRCSLISNSASSTANEDETTKEPNAAENTTGKSAHIAKTVYLGGLQDGCSAEDICSAVRAGGPLYSIRLLPEKNCAFLAFIDPESAENLFIMAKSRRYGGGLVVKGKGVFKVSYAPRDQHIPWQIVEALKQGATRCIYVSGLPASLMDANELRADFEQYGLIEQVHLIPDKNTAFVNFCNLTDAVKAYDALKSNDDENGKYGKCNIRYAQDRVSGEPRNWQTIIDAYKQNESNCNSDSFKQSKRESEE